MSRLSRRFLLIALMSTCVLAGVASADPAACRMCGGTGQLYCGSCNGNGKTSCGMCYGMGRKNGSMCSWCLGGGSQRCSACSGMGIVQCRGCGGSGLDTNEDVGARTIVLNGIQFLGPFPTTDYLTNDYAAFVVLHQLADGLWYVIVAGDSYPSGVRTVLEQSTTIGEAIRARAQGPVGVAVYYSNDSSERDRIWRGVLKALGNWDGKTLLE